jgi:anthranilate synthase component II
MKKIVIIDNYDSFTYNLVHYLEDLNTEITVLRNDEFELDELIPFEKILLSPGPGIPDEAGLLKKVIQKYAKSKSILGICLGQQAIGEVFDGNLINLKQVFHGVSTKVILTVDNDPLFKSLPAEFEAGRYHSWAVNPNDFPETLEITSTDEEGQIMSLRHKTLDIKGIQYHPESILTPLGKTILKNWVNS